MTGIRDFADKTMADIRAMTADWRLGRADGPPRVELPPRMRGGASPRLRLGRITGHNGLDSQNRRYNAEAVDDSTIAVSLQRPRFQQYSAAFEVHAAESNTPCILGKYPAGANEEWFLLFVDDEYLLAETCQQDGGAGLGEDEFASATEFGRGSSHFTNITIPETVFDVADNTAKLSIGVYTFPTAAILLKRITLTDLVLDRGGNTLGLNMEVGFGSAASTGTGTTLTGTEEDWFAGVTVGPLDVTLNNLLNVNSAQDGRSAAKAIHFNLAPKTAYCNAGQTGTVTISGRFRITWETISP